MRIYLDNAATTPLSKKAREAMVEVMESNFGNPSSIHWYGRQAKALLEECRKKIAHHLRASTSEIFFTSGGSEANNLALKSSVRDLGVNRIISSKAEHPSVLKSLEQIQTAHDVAVEFLNLDKRGLIDYHQLETLLTGEKRFKTLVSLMHVNNETGVCLDLKKVATMCNQNNTLFHSDTVQSMGKIKIDLEESPMNFLAASAHKFHGPKGVGFVYINANNIVKPIIHGGSQERNMRAGTENLAGIVGLTAAFEEMTENQQAGFEHMKKLKLKLAQFIQQHVPGSEILGNGVEETFPTILNTVFPSNQETELLVMKLDIHGISVSGGSACSSGALTRSHVLDAIQVRPDLIPVRFSFSHFTTMEEIDVLCEVLKNIFLKRESSEIV